ncbi:MAG: zinc ribbon domain-containing protein [Chloroflexi bacterium]|nr:zinc ribbon domain-containing protein [Chloroflexota bacterium]
MPTYDYRCKNCDNVFALFYKTYAAYDAAHKTCPRCGGDALTRLITGVHVAQPTRDYSKMSSGEMLAVFEGGKPQEIGRMFEQVGGGAPELGDTFHNTTERLLKGEAPEKVERDLSASGGGES